MALESLVQGFFSRWTRDGAELRHKHSLDQQLAWDPGLFTLLCAALNPSLEVFFLFFSLLNKNNFFPTGICY